MVDSKASMRIFRDSNGLRRLLHQATDACTMPERRCAEVSASQCSLSALALCCLDPLTTLSHKLHTNLTRSSAKPVATHMQASTLQIIQEFFMCCSECILAWLLQLNQEFTRYCVVLHICIVNFPQHAFEVSNIFMPQKCNSST